MSQEIERPSPEEIILFEKDPKTKIATITLNRPEHLNAPTIAARQRYAKLVQKCNVDDDVKVLVIRGVGDHLGSGGDLPEQSEMFSDKHPDSSLLHEFEMAIGFAQAGAPGPERLHFGPGEHQTRFQGFQDVVEVTSLPVVGHDLDAPVRGLRFG